MAVAWSWMESQLKTNVLEVRFTRRIPKKNWAKTRRMICTKSAALLDSEWGANHFYYDRPKCQLPYNAQQKNLAIGFDPMRAGMRDSYCGNEGWRAIPCESVNVLSVIPLRTDEQIELFHKYWFDFMTELLVRGGGNYQQSIKSWMDA